MFWGKSSLWLWLGRYSWSVRLTTVSVRHNALPGSACQTTGLKHGRQLVYHVAAPLKHLGQNVQWCKQAIILAFWIRWRIAFAVYQRIVDCFWNFMVVKKREFSCTRVLPYSSGTTGLLLGFQVNPIGLRRVTENGVDDLSHAAPHSIQVQIRSALE